MNFLKNPTAKNNADISSCFLLWNEVTHQLKLANNQAPTPVSLLPQPDSLWPDQLPAPHVQRLYSLFRQKQPQTITLNLTNVCWQLHVTPTDSEH